MSSSSLGQSRCSYREHSEPAVFDLVDDPGADLGVAQLVLGLGFEDRILDLDGQGADHAVPHILADEFLAGVLVDPLEDPLAEGGEMGAALVGIGAVDKGEIGLAVTVGMGEGELQGLVLVMDGLVELAAVDLLVQQIEQAIGGDRSSSSSR